MDMRIINDAVNGKFMMRRREGNILLSSLFSRCMWSRTTTQLYEGYRNI